MSVSSRCLAALLPSEADCARRAHVPLFVIDDGFTPLTCSQIDRMFDNLAVAALGQARAKMLSFHSCRVFAACAHLANKESQESIQALCRWRTAESLKIYARLNPADYAARVRRMVTTRVDSTIAARLPVLDDDDLHRDLASALPGLEIGKDLADLTEVHADDDSDDDAEVAGGGASADAVDTSAVPAQPATRPGVSQPAQHAPRQRRPRQDQEVRIAVQQANPKRAGSKCWRRYEDSKGAKTRAEYLAAGGTPADFLHDSKHGFIVTIEST